MWFHISTVIEMLVGRHTIRHQKPTLMGRECRRTQMASEGNQNTASYRLGRKQEAFKIGAETENEFMRDSFIFLHSSIYS